MLIAQNQAWTNRAPHMKSLFGQAFGSKKITGLEIGVWYGLGSTQIWLESCAAGSEFHLIDSWTRYASPEDLNYDGSPVYPLMDNLSTDAFLSAFLQVRKFEDLRKKDDIKINLIRGDSRLFLPSFQSESFDFIYIDGDHKYESAVSDVIQAKRLIKKKYGVICGDDLELLPTQRLYELSKQYPTRDYLRNEVEVSFHPGVLAAIFEEFDSVSMLNGFWWVEVIDGKFHGKFSLR